MVQRSEFAGQTRTLQSGPFAGRQIVIEDYWGNVRAQLRASRSDSEFDGMLYGKIDGIGECVWPEHLFPAHNLRRA